MIQHRTPIHGRNYPHWRTAYTLIELVVVLSVSSTLLVVATQWVHQSMKFGAIIRSRDTHHQSLLRLANLLRDDVNSGQAISIEQPDDLMIVTTSSKRVRYTITPIGVRRAMMDGERTIAQDTFSVASTSAIRWIVDEMPRSIGLVIERGNRLSPSRVASAPDESRSRIVELCVRATVNRWPATPGDFP